MERKRPLLEDQGPSDIPIKRSRDTQEESIEDAEQFNQKATDEEKFSDLHVSIEKGDFESVKRVVESHVEEHFFSYDETSALYKAFDCEKYEIISFLIHRGAKFVGFEEQDAYHFDIDRDRLNYLLFQYNKKSEKSCVYKLISLSQSPQVLDGERLNAVMSMYESFLESETMKLLMRVLENVDFDIVFDFQSDKVNRVHRMYNEEAEIYGLTLTNVREIFIGAQFMLSGDPRKRAKVYGVAAEELCHLAMSTVFNNDAKPYRKEDRKLIQEFGGIVKAVEALIVRSCHIESVIEDVYGYPRSCWECELIARVPHVVGLYGEEFGRMIFKECSELERLLTFYEQKVIPECTVTSSNTKSDRMMNELKSEFISFKEKQVRPVMHPPFMQHVVREEVTVMSTNCIKLCALHAYHELKDVYGNSLERKCLFFGRECFEKKREEIMNALKCKLCEYFILVLDDKELHPRKLLCEYLDHFEEFKSGGMNIIIISNSQLLDQEFRERVFEYKWEILTDEYKHFRTWPLEYIFKGDKQILSVEKEYVPQLFSEEDMMSIMNGELVEVQDGGDLKSQGYNPKTYVNRQFSAKIVDRRIFECSSDETKILIYGLRHWDLQENSIDEGVVQWLKGADDEIQEGKTIFIGDKYAPMSFKDFVRKSEVENCVCLQYMKKVFYLVRSKGDVCKEYEKEMRQSEEEMIEMIQSNKSIIVSDDAGCGKSTVMSSLIQHVRKKIHNSWVLKADLNKFLVKDEGPYSEENEDEFEEVFVMLGLRNGFEKCRFKERGNQYQYFIFLDALDEVPSEYKSKALKLISFLRKNTDVRIMITTRMHHEKELEEILYTFSHQLVPFDNSSQVDCLGKLWKWKLKFPNGEGQLPQKDKNAISRKINMIIGEFEKAKTDLESHNLVLSLKEIKLEHSVNSIRTKIDDLELNRLANSILNKTSLDEETLDFMGIPLHLFMIGEIYFDSNFDAEISSGIHNIYSEFIGRKIRIHVEEKQGILYRGRGRKNTMKKDTDDAYRIHIELSNQLIDKGRIDSKMSEEDLELCKALGVVSIKGEEVDFLHHTFAEYFKAESIRRALNKNCFTDMLFEENNTVVRRFLANSLEEEKFENLTIESFEDMNFVFDALSRFVCEYDFSFRLRDYETYLSDFAKIVKSLLESFENTVDEDSLNVFFVELESKVLNLQDWHNIGACITVKMFKLLFHRKVNFEMILSMVKHYSNPNEVIELLNDCVSMEITNGSETKRRIGGGNEISKSERLSKVLKFKNSNEVTILEGAISNVRLEVFAKILEFSKEILGKVKFVDDIVKSEEYSEIMNDFIDRADFNRICGLLKTFLSVFGSEINIFFDNNLKFRILKRSLDKCRRSRRIEGKNPFGVMIDLFKEYFGTEKLKDVFLSRDSRWFYLIHYLVTKNRNVIEILNLIKSIFDDGSNMKDFLMFTDGKSRNMFHSVAKNGNVNFGEILKFCSENLEKKEIKHMLVSRDAYGENVLQLSFQCKSWKVIIDRIGHIKNALADEADQFKKLLKSKNKELRNIFHFAASCSDINDISFFNLHLDPSEIKGLLTERSKSGKTCLHYGANSSSRNLIVFLEYSYEMLKEEKNKFEDLIKAKDEDGCTFLHWFVLWYCFNFREEFVSKVIKAVKEKVSHDNFEELLRIRNIEGETFLQMKGIYREEITKFCQTILAENLFEEILEKKENCQEHDEDDDDDDDSYFNDDDSYFDDDDDDDDVNDDVDDDNDFEI